MTIRNVHTSDGVNGIVNAIAASSNGDTINYDDGINYSPFTVNLSNLLIQCTSVPALSTGINWGGAFNGIIVNGDGNIIKNHKSGNVSGTRSAAILVNSGADGNQLLQSNIDGALNGFCIKWDGGAPIIDSNYFANGGQNVLIRSQTGSTFVNNISRDANTMLVDTSSPGSDDTGGNTICWERCAGDITHVHLCQNNFFYNAGAPHSYDYDIDGGVFEMFDAPYLKIYNNAVRRWLGTLYECGVHPSGTTNYGSTAVVNPASRRHMPGIEISGNYCYQDDNTQILGNTGVLHTVERGGMIIRVGDNMKVQNNFVAGFNFWAFVLGRYDAYFAGPLSGLDINSNIWATTLADFYHLRWASDPVAEPPPWTIKGNSAYTSAAYGMKHEQRGAWSSTGPSYPTTGSDVTYTSPTSNSTATRLLGNDVTGESWTINNSTSANAQKATILAMETAREVDITQNLQALGVIPGAVLNNRKFLLVGGVPKLVVRGGVKKFKTIG